MIGMGNKRKEKVIYIENIAKLESKSLMLVWRSGLTRCTQVAVLS